MTIAGGRVGLLEKTHVPRLVDVTSFTQRRHPFPSQQSSLQQLAESCQSLDGASLVMLLRQLDEAWTQRGSDELALSTPAPQLQHTAPVAAYSFGLCALMPHYGRLCRRCPRYLLAFFVPTVSKRVWECTDHEPGGCVHYASVPQFHVGTAVMVIDTDCVSKPET
jgi:hypothetical protein